TDVPSLTATKMAAYYHQMLANDQINIVVSGDIATDEMVQALSNLPFTPRPSKQLDLFYSQAELQAVNVKNDREAVSQSKLNLAYSFPVDFKSPARFAAMVFNELFGGSALSLLFQNVREKN